MRRAERVNTEWQTPAHPDWTWQHVEIEVLMDIRDELRRLNSLLHCTNFVGLPAQLREITRKMPTPRKRKAKGTANG